MSDFNFYVSLTGITGAKLSNVEDIQHNIGKLKKVSAAPVAVGFGMSTPEDAAQGIEGGGWSDRLQRHR